MKNKMMKVAGLLLASTTMLIANGAVASESIQDKPCEAEVMEDGQLGRYIINFTIAIFTAGKVEEAFNIESKCKSMAAGPGYTYPMEITSVTGSTNSHSFANDISDNSKITTFTSQDGTLEIKVTERDDTKKEEKISESEKWTIYSTSLNVVNLIEDPTFKTKQRGIDTTTYLISKEKKGFTIGGYELLTTREELANTNPEDWKVSEDTQVNGIFNPDGDKEVWVNEKDSFVGLRDIRVNTVQTDIIYQSKPNEDGTKITVTRTKLL